MAVQSESALLALPDPCLLAVLQLFTDDQRSLFSAARAHSRLHQAAVEVVHSITVKKLHEELLQSVLGYLSKHGQHINSLNLSGRDAVVGRTPTLNLCQLAPHIQLSSLQLEDMNVRLQPGVGLQSALGSPAAGALPSLKHLQLCECRLFDDDEGLAATLAQLPGLEHLSIDNSWSFSTGGGAHNWLQATVLQGLPQLTHLELAGMIVIGVDRVSPVLQPLQALTRLADLRLAFQHCRVTADELSGACHLTCLVLEGAWLQPGALAGKTKLQHLHLSSCKLQHDGGMIATAQLLSQLQQMHQLTHLHLAHTLKHSWDGNPPAAAFSSLTASSRLQYLDVSSSWAAAGVWQHMFPAGRELPHLQELSIARMGFYRPPPDGTRLTSCCRRLQRLDVQGLVGCGELLGPLQGLSELHTLHLGDDAATSATDLEALCQLTGLKELSVPSLLEGQLLQLTRLKQLTSLSVDCCRGRQHRLDSKDPGDEPVWRQLLQLYLEQPDPAVAQQAFAGLAD